MIPNSFEEEDVEEDQSIVYANAAPTFMDISRKSLDEVLDSSEDIFQQRLFKLIDESGLDDVSVYKKRISTGRSFRESAAKKL